MVDNKHVVRSELKTWVQPELKRLAAGSAEQGNNLNEDGGPVGNARS